MHAPRVEFTAIALREPNGELTRFHSNLNPDLTPEFRQSEDETQGCTWFRRISPGQRREKNPAEAKRWHVRSRKGLHASRLCS